MIQVPVKEIILLLMLSYLIGSIQPSYFVGKLYRKDLRKIGSRNMGASNVYKHIGKWQGIFVAIIDAAKGFLVFLMARNLSLDVVYLAGLFVVAGHNWPFYLGFKGGRGLATTSGLVIASLLLLHGWNKLIAMAFILNFWIMKYLLILPFRK